MMFRFKALQKMREPDELDSPSLLAAPRGWIAVFVILFVVVGAGVWAFAGTIPVSVSAPGLLTYPHGTASVQTPESGTVTKVPVAPGKTVRQGDPLVVLSGTTGGATTVASPFPGRVVGVAVAEAQVVDRGTVLVTVERFSPSDPMVAMLFVPDQQVAGLVPGQAVQLAVANAPSARFGLLQGRITSVSSYPLTSAQVSALVGGDLAARPFLGSSAPHLVVVSLDRDPSTVTGFAWSTAEGPPSPLRSQVALTGTIRVADESPISLIFGR